MQDIGKVRPSLQNFMVHSDIEASVKICEQEIEKNHQLLLHITNINY